MKRTSVRGVMRCVVLTMYFLATFHLSVRWYWVRQAFVVNARSSSDTFFTFLDEKYFWVWVASGTAFSINSFIADIVLIWRCWIIWSRNWKVIILPILCTITGTIFSGLFLYQETYVSTTVEDVSAWGGSVNWGVPYFTTSLATTLMCTMLIIYRLWTVGRTTSPISQGFKTYKSVIEILIQSAALYSVTMILFLAFFMQNDIKSMYPLPILDSMTGMVPTSIMIRVAAGWSHPQLSRDAGSVSLQLTPTRHPGTLSTLPDMTISESGSDLDEQKLDSTDHV
ncbi:hypothetical protein DFS33DRAFT_656289 [Desarmillaria ectypa]|nr:hypothetical protein DFS33DRAFT_656289 [Desarmillaria ectypa]